MRDEVIPVQQKTVLPRVSGAAHPNTNRDPIELREERNQKELAKQFKYSTSFERQIEWKETHPERFEALSPRRKMEIGRYQKYKAAAEALGRDVTGGDAA